MSKKSIKALVDDYAQLTVMITELKKEQEALRPQVIALGEGLHAGREHALVVDFSTRQSISVSVAKSLLTAAQLEAATVVSDITTIRVEK